jgi:hypothetical protein
MKRMKADSLSAACYPHDQGGKLPVLFRSLRIKELVGAIGIKGVICAAERKDLQLRLLAGRTPPTLEQPTSARGRAIMVIPKRSGKPRRDRLTAVASGSGSGFDALTVAPESAECSKYGHVVLV